MLHFKSWMISTVLFMSCGGCFGGRVSKPFVISHFNDQVLADTSKKVLVEKFNIPEGLIETKIASHPCSYHTRAVVHICIENHSIRVSEFKAFDFYAGYRVFLEKELK
ncbi:MAG: hypothetical protein HOE90_25050 [Bacteriovoracaceae bacterium]|jgi:hypothetical protein|nr:hypothetical protein [Bacteriovoracaceae bacterium]